MDGPLINEGWRLWDWHPAGGGFIFFGPDIYFGPFYGPLRPEAVPDVFDCDAEMIIPVSKDG